MLYIEHKTINTACKSSQDFLPVWQSGGNQTEACKYLRYSQTDQQANHNHLQDTAKELWYSRPEGKTSVEDLYNKQGSKMPTVVQPVMSYMRNRIWLPTQRRFVWTNGYIELSNPLLWPPPPLPLPHPPPALPQLKKKLSYPEIT